MRYVLAVGLVAAIAVAPCHAEGVRIKDIVRPLGARHNQLVGYGLVVGLDGTGDSAQVAFTNQAVRNLVTRFGNRPEAGARIRTKNAAAVVLTADLPPFARPGDRIDVVASSLGDARSLQGGILLQAPLEGADGRVYAVAQGPLSLGGFAAEGAGAQLARNHPTVARIPNGALIEAEVPMAVASEGEIALSLVHRDSAVAVAIARAISEARPEITAEARDAGAVVVSGLEGSGAEATELLAAIGELRVVIDTPARIVMNERTGTIVVGGPVTIAPVAVAHGSLTVEIQTTALVSQPPPFSPGETVAVPETRIAAIEEEAALMPVQGATVDDLVRALNALRATPRDLIAILQAMKEAGAIRAAVEVL